MEKGILDIREFWAVLKKRKKLIIFIPLISIVLSTIFSFFIITPIYEANTSIVIGKKINEENNQYSYNDVIMYQKLMKTYAFIAESHDVIKKTVDTLNIDISIEEFQQSTEVIPQPDTQILDIKIQNNSPEIATKMINALTEAFIEEVKKIYPSDNIHVVENGIVSNSPVKPRKILNIAIAFLVGIMISFVIVFVLESMKNSINSENDIERYIEIPVLGIIPRCTYKGNENIIIEKYGKSPEAEACKTLRTNIQYSSIDKKIKTLLVTSSGVTEGKSTISANLALTMQQGNKKVLLIDCDLRKPSLHKLFNVSNTEGLLNYLIGELNIKEVVKEYGDNVYILPTGGIPPNPVELLTSIRMKDFLQSASDQFDYIIIDSPPVNTFTDAQILSTMIDGVLFVISSGETSREQCMRAKKLLLNVKANILGVILNKNPTIIDKRYYYKNLNLKQKKRNKI